MVSGFLLVDILVVVLLLAALISGCRSGALSAALGALGIVAGLVVGLGVASALVGLSEVPGIRVLLVLATVVLFVGVGNIGGATVGATLRDRMRTKSSQRWDSGLGAAFQAIVAAMVIWLVSLPVAANVGGPVGTAVRESRILSAMDSAAPTWGKQVPEQIAALIDVTGLPPMVSPFEAKGVEVADPDPADVDPAVIEALRPSVVHVLGDAESCHRRLSGSGYVAAPDYVITNAHVVAGTNAVEVDTVLGVKEADVVLYNPEVDLAVLHVPSLGIAPLDSAKHQARSGDGALLLGFPASGPFTATPARVRDKVTISGPNIYANGRTEREAYILRGQVRQGNSGGPLVTPDGKVVGVIFGTAVDGSNTGYALTFEQVNAVVGEIGRLTEIVDTQNCMG
ncbi:hypothetical protein CJ203_04470 [Corynebacterium tuscaniense]|uniref:Serine protease n=1 Tax=Corynebacterium tuscaniense TaxID=302449 RepID=A0A2N6T5I9_9CORY|nr:MarP family serine protease [Corynebacterium tuscaniense]PMC64572.1 hypothetical protein CJ203_04470 [Corynebacterium tuscaniense]